MGIQNKPSLARKRLSTLAVTTTLAAVGVGVIGTGAANAATTSGVAQTQDSGTPTTTSPHTPVIASATSGTTADDYLNATVDLTGTKFDMTKMPSGGTAIATITWKDGGTPQNVLIGTGGTPVEPIQHFTYDKAGTYNITLTLTDGDDADQVSTSKSITIVAPPVTVKAPTLAAAVSSKTVAYGGSVTVDLKGSSVDPTTDPTKATTTISWGDKTADSVITGDPSKILSTDAKLTHAYAAAGTYHLTVDLVDSKGNKATQVAYDITVNAKGAVQVLRAAGATRYDTGLIISQHAWADNGKAATDTLHRQQAKAVVLATGNAFPDALAGVPLAKKAQGPLLLTDGKAATLNPDVLTEIKRVLPKDQTKIYILGGEAAVSAGIEKQLNDLGYTVDRLAGATRYDTALKIAQDGMGNPSHIIVARGDQGKNNDGFADALAAGPYAANVFGGGDSAVVLTNADTMDPNTKAYVQSKLHVGAMNVAAIGGPAVAAVNGIPGAGGLFAPAAGATRYETAAMVAKAFLPSGAADKVGIATGLKFPDALTGGAYMASVGGPLLLTDPSALPDATAGALGLVKTTAPEVDIFGGTAAVSDDVATSIAKLFSVTTIGKF
ncbi:MAG: hypothetical protein HOW97_39225 [Catenulispora sp.]|nr:hypothetical protein [Catenulispora sp.]